MKHHVMVLGAGMVGRAMAWDMARKHKVTAIDRDAKALRLCREMGLETLEADLSDHQKIPGLIGDAELVISAVPGFMGYKVVESVIACGKSVVDISFMPEDFMELHGMAKKHRVSVITDCGVAPGIPNLFIGRHSLHREIYRFEYMVGGLPRERKFPFEYKAPFSPIDVLEEYTRPARIMDNGSVMETAAMSEPEMVYFEGLGHLEAFNTDGLRSLLQTMRHIPYMKEKTLRYPGHIQLIKSLQAAGFFSDREITVGRQQVRPVEVTNQLLMKEWHLEAGEPEFTVMRMIIEDSRSTEHYDLFDEYDPKTGFSSMARTTGFTATAAANMLLDGIFTDSGVYPPELIGRDEKCHTYIMDYLEQRNITLRRHPE